MFAASTIVAVLGLAATSHAHVTMNTPKPFSGMISSPLSPNGDNFPCQRSVSFGEGGATTMPLGSTQPISFTGSAVHGGGSCQISVTYDKNPSKSTVWKVIHSIQGGCPMRNIDANNGNDASLVSPSKYSFTVPKDLPTGDAILAWTWFNKIGNREMYMNCAPITLTGGNARRGEDVLEARNATQLVERDQAAFSALPNMFKANIGNCVTKEGINLLFPNPGASVETNPDVRPHEAPPKECDTASGNPVPAPVPSSSSAAAPSPTTTRGSQPSLPGGIFITVSKSSTTTKASASSPPKPSTTSKATATTSKAATTTKAAATTSGKAPTTSQAPVKTTTFIVVPTKATATPPAQTGTSGAQSGPCTQEGRWNCIGGKSFQQCASGSWSTPQSLAAGTKCTAGQSDMIDITHIGARAESEPQPLAKPKTKKRVVRITKKHLQRHAHRS